MGREKKRWREATRRLANFGFGLVLTSLQKGLPQTPTGAPTKKDAEAPMPSSGYAVPAADNPSPAGSCIRRFKPAAHIMMGGIFLISFVHTYDVCPKDIIKIAPFFSDENKGAGLNWCTRRGSNPKSTASEAVMLSSYTTGTSWRRYYYIAISPTWLSFWCKIFGFLVGCRGRVGQSRGWSTITQLTCMKTLPSQMRPVNKSRQRL